MKFIVLSYGRYTIQYFKVIFFLFLFRGKKFSRAFAEIGSIRSLILSSVKVLALTATATKDTLDCVSHSLSLENPAIIGLPPNQLNIKYTIEYRTGIVEFLVRLLLN